MRKIALICCLFWGCSEPFDFGIEAASIDIVDGKVSTEIGATYVRIYRLNGEEQENIKGLTVRVIDNNGNEMSFIFDESINSYRPVDPNFVGIVGGSYRLEVNDVGDRFYYSEMDSIPPPIEFDISVKDTSILELSTVDLVVSRDAAAAIAEFESQSGFYSKLEFSYSYRNYYTTADTIRVADPNDFILYESGLVQSGAFVKIPTGYKIIEPWFFVNPASFCDTIPISRCGDPCCRWEVQWQTKLEIEVEYISPSTYTFWQNAKKLTENDGLLFDTYPFPLEGNVRCDNCENDVVGFFRTVSYRSRSTVELL